MNPAIIKETFRSGFICLHSETSAFQLIIRYCLLFCQNQAIGNTPMAWFIHSANVILFLGSFQTGSSKKDTEELLTKVADYSNTEQDFFSRRMCAMFAAAIIGVTIFAVIDILGLERTQPYATIVSVTCGFVSGTLITGFLYASRYMVKLKAARARLTKKLRKLEAQ